MRCQFTTIEGTLIKNGDKGRRGGEGGPGETDRGGRQRGQKGSGRSIACKTDRDRGKVIKRTVAVDDAPSALALA